MLILMTFHKPLFCLDYPFIIVCQIFFLDYLSYRPLPRLAHKFDMGYYWAFPASIKKRILLLAFFPTNSTLLIFLYFVHYLSKPLSQLNTLC